jgi:hypothetical protein
MVVSREAAASRPSTGSGVEGGNGVEAEHWVEGEEGGVEASKRRRGQQAAASLA